MPARRIQLVAAVVGAASLGAEIAAARLLAPWFGASTIIWANTIATVLVALSAGYWVGGRLADRDPTLAGLSKLVLGAAVLLARRIGADRLQALNDRVHVSRQQGVPAALRVLVH